MSVFSERFIHIHFGFLPPPPIFYVEQKFILLQSLSFSCQLILSAILQNAVRFQIEMEVVLGKTEPIYLPFEVLNNIRNVHASQQGLGRVILLKDNHQIKYGFSTIKGWKCTYPLVAGFACNDKFHLKGLDLAATEINGKTSMYFGEEMNRSKKLHTDLRQSTVFCRVNMVYFLCIFNN